MLDVPRGPDERTDVTEDKTQLAVRRCELIDLLNTQLSAERRVAIQTELSAINAKIKLINTMTAARLKADADKRKIAGLAEAANNAARARSNLDAAEDPPPDQQAIIDSWVDALLDRAGVGGERHAPGTRSLVDARVPEEVLAAIQYLCHGLRVLADGEELPPLPNTLSSTPAKRKKAR